VEQPSDEQQQVGPSQPSGEQSAVDVDDTAAVESNQSFSVDELTVRLRKSLTLEDPPADKSIVAVEQSEPVDADLGSDCAKISSEEQQPADDSATFFDCENTSFVEQVLPDDVVDAAVDSQPSAQPEADVPEPSTLDVAYDKPDSDSMETVDKMADNSDQPASPPIAVTKGSYAINWDDFDEFSDPFMPKKGLASSPQKSPVVPACVGVEDGAGDPNFVGEVDPFKPSRRLTNSPTAADPAGEGSAEKQTQRLSINNNLPEPFTEGTISSSANGISESDAVETSVSAVTESNTQSADDGDGAEPITECSDIVE